VSKETGPNGWNEYGRLVLSKLDEHDEELKKNTEAIEKLTNSLYVFRAKVYAWATVFAAAAAIVIRMIPNPWD